MNPPTDWTTPLAILVAGIILGAMVIFYFLNRRKSGPTIAVDAERKDLEAKRDALIAQLRALPDDAVDERARLETETANVLRKLDATSPLPAARGERQVEGPPAMNPTVKGFLWGSASTAALALLFFYVSNAATPRPQGEMATGGITSQQQQQQQPQAASDPMVQQLEAAVQRDPNNNQLRLDLAQMYLERDNLMGVFEQTKVVLDRDPRNARALTFGALVRMAMGEVDTATEMLQQATRNDSKSLDSWVALAWVYAQSNRMKDAEAAIGEAIKASPENRGRLEDVLAQMKSHASQPAQEQPAAAQAPQAAPQGPGVRVTLQLDAAATRRSGVLFVIARNPQGGPPVAVKRVMASQFPLTVELTSADSMLGQPLPASFRVEARLDSDGDAATRPPTDPSGAQDGVTPGAILTLALK
jgi:tetratricopeptide (TPR) repeat protein